MSMMQKAKINPKIFLGSLLLLLSVICILLLTLALPLQAQVTNPQTGSIGLEGTIPTDPPSTGATITFPTNGQTFTDIPVTVQGICPDNLLVKIFKNEVFAGAVPCEDGSYEIDIDLFSGQNELIARVFDVLDQPGPDSNTVTVTYDDGPEDAGVEQIILTSNFALRGADAGTELTWPLALSGGVGPYAVSIDWGDGETTQIPLELAGNFTIRHTYAEPGVYRLIVRATDSRDKSAFLQLVAVANGESGQDTTAAGAGGEGGIATRIRVPLLPVYIMFFFVISTFWLGRRYEIRRIKQAVRTGKAVQL